VLRLKLTDHIIVVRIVANSLVLLGLIGTVIGFIIALSGIDPEAASQVENVAAIASTLINGMSVALNTTLVGALLYVWLIINYGILTSGTVDLITAIIDMGEARAAET
jgi:biopolymer transport protein ExbB/TolQ